MEQQFCLAKTSSANYWLEHNFPDEHLPGRGQLLSVPARPGDALDLLLQDKHRSVPGALRKA